MLLGTTRPLSHCIRWEKGFKMYLKGSGYDNRGPCSPPAAAAVLPAWWRRTQGASHGKESPISKDFLFNSPHLHPKLDQGKDKHNTYSVCMYVHLCRACSLSHYEPNLNCVTKHPLCVCAFLCVCSSYPGYQRRVACAVLISTWSHQSLSDSTAELCMCLSVNSLQMWEGDKENHMELLYHPVRTTNSLLMQCYLVSYNIFGSFFLYKNKIKETPP